MGFDPLDETDDADRTLPESNWRKAVFFAIALIFALAVASQFIPVDWP